MPDSSYAHFYHIYLTRVSSIVLHIIPLYIFFIYYPPYILFTLLPSTVILCIHCRGDYPPSWQSWHCSRTFSAQTDFI